MGIKTIIKKLSKKNPAFRKLVRFTAKTLRKTEYLIFYCLRYRIKDNIILFESFKGVKFCDSPRSIYEELQKNDEYKDYIFVWAFARTKSEERFDSGENTRFVQFRSADYYKYLASAKYIVTNSRGLAHFIKKKGQTYIQTWHGTPLKRLGCDLGKEYASPYNTPAEVYRQYIHEGKLIDYILSPSAFATQKLSSAFNLEKLGKKGNIVEKGYPRNDFLFRFTAGDVERVKAEMNLPEGKKIILYAPTFRDNKHETALGYTFTPDVDFELLQKEMEEEYIILYRPHYFVAKSFDFSGYEGFIYDTSYIEDINELYIISDILITDYSSVFFDFACLKKPILFFMYDIEAYRDHLRGFYLNLDELPGPVVQTGKELADTVRHIHKITGEYSEKYKVFNRKFNYLEDGHATQRVIGECFNS